MAVALNEENLKRAINERFKKLQKATDGRVVRIGIKEGKTNKGVEIATYARENEFGVFSKGIPSRPFLRTTFKGEKANDMGKRAFKALQEAVLQNYDAEIALQEIADQGAIMVRKNIREGQWVPNKPSTLSRKRGSKPLIDSGEMIKSVEGWVVKDGK